MSIRHADADIALFLKRMQWTLLAFGVCWLVWLLAPVLTPFVLAALLGWLGDPLVDRSNAPGARATPPWSWSSAR